MGLHAVGLLRSAHDLGVGKIHLGKRIQKGFLVKLFGILEGKFDSFRADVSFEGIMVYPR